MRTSLGLIFLLLVGCAKETLLFDQSYASYCELYDDVVDFTLKHHAVWGPKDKEHLTRSAFKKYQIEIGSPINDVQPLSCAQIEKTFSHRKDQTQSAENFYRGMISGYLATLDPHSRYLPPSNVEVEQKRIKNKLKTSGVEFSYRHGVIGEFSKQNRLWIDFVHPKASVSLPVGAEVVEVQGQSIFSKSFSDIRALISDNAETYQVKIKGDPKVYTVDRHHDIFPASYIQKLHHSGQEYMWVRGKSFTKGMAKSMITQIENNKHYASGIVLDLRGNGGGLISEVDQLLEYFLDPSITYKEIQYRKKSSKKHKTHQSAQNDLPLLVLVDSNSASASEIFAGAIQALQRGTIVGDYSFGKMTSQSSYPISEKNGIGGMIYVTEHVLVFADDSTGQYYRIAPDVVFQDPETSLMLSQTQEVVFEKQYFNAIKPYQVPKYKSEPITLDPCPVEVLRDCTHKKVISLF